MRITLGLFLAAAALAATAGALAARASKDPRSLALRRSDLPAGAVRTSERLTRSAVLPGGGRGQAYRTTFAFRKGSHREIVTALVVTTENAGPAHAVLAQARKELARQAHRFIRLPSYGDEQLAAVVGDLRNDETAALIWVRKNAVAWELSIEADPLLKHFTSAEALAELAKYAPKQRLRAGNG